MKDSTKTEIISIGNTFLASFVTFFATSLSTGTIQWTAAFWVSLGIAGVRFAVKAVINSFLPATLGGTKSV